MWVEVVLVSNLGQAVDLLVGIPGAGFGDDVVQRDALGKQIVAADSSFRVAGVRVRSPPKGDDNGGDLAAVELDGLVETGMKDGRRTAGVLRRAEDGNGVGGTSLVSAGNRGNLHVDPAEPAEASSKQQADEHGSKAAAGAWLGRGSHGFRKAVRPV